VLLAAVGYDARRRAGTLGFKRKINAQAKA